MTHYLWFYNIKNVHYLKLEDHIFFVFNVTCEASQPTVHVSFSKLSIKVVTEECHMLSLYQQRPCKDGIFLVAVTGVPIGF